MRALAWFAGFVVLFGVIVGFELHAFGGLGMSQPSSLPGYSVHVGGTDVHVSLARTSAEQERGLGGRSSLSPDEGMLFVFPQDGSYAFWMKDMSFSIDIIWLAVDGTVVYIVPNLSPATYPNTYAPPKPARFVLEVPAGFAAAHDVRIGDLARLP